MQRSDCANWRTGPKQKPNPKNIRLNFYNNTKDRHSYGIACCRIYKNKPEIMLICKRFTYAYNLFANGNYSAEDNNEIITMLSGMTIDEKLDLLSLNFIQIWYRLWLNSIQKNQNFFAAKNKFEQLWVVDNGERLRSLISKSSTCDKLWEIPKGRKRNKNEPDIHCSVREFGEETGIHKKSYKLFPGAKKTHSYIDAGVRYINTYYIGIAKHNIEPRINFALQDQIDEISDIRWMSIEDIRYVDPSGRLETVVKPIFNFIKKTK